MLVYCVRTQGRMAAKLFSVMAILFLVMLGGGGRSASAIRHLHDRKDIAGLEHHHRHHQVGGALAWTPAANPQEWASRHTLYVGDTIGFKYHAGQDSVLLVDRIAYHACDSSSPLASFRTGNDAITFKRKGHYYFISGIEHNCKYHGQKFNIRIPRGPHSAAALPPVPLAAAIAAPAAALVSFSFCIFSFLLY